LPGKWDPTAQSAESNHASAAAVCFLVSRQISSTFSEGVEPSEWMAEAAVEGLLDGFARHAKAKPLADEVAALIEAGECKALDAGSAQQQTG
jgi:hypothetical protein